MVQARLKKLLTTNWHFIGVIFFFLIHGYREHRGLVPLAGMLWLLVQLLAVGCLLFAISRWWYKSSRKAGLFTSFVAVIVLFFGVFEDWLSGFQFTAGLSRLLYFLPICFGSIVVVLVLLKKTRRPLNKPLLFINIVLLLYLLVDIGGLIFQNNKPGKVAVPAKQTIVCDTCARPSIYLVLLDEYMGSDGLQSYFHYNNQAFEDSLKQEGFHVVQHPQSNYRLTIFSMASLFNMDYLSNIGKASIKDHYAYSMAVRGVRDNTVSAFLEASGYRIANYSGFDLAQAPAGYSTGLLPDKTGLLTSQTMWYRIAKYLPEFLLGKGLIPAWETKVEDQYIRNNEAAMQGVLELSAKKDTTPVFTYLHLMMPHLPFVFDSTGQRIIPLRQRKSYTLDEVDNDYLQYLVYTNRRMVDFLHRLKQQTGGKAVILLMSDHGCRGTARKDNKLSWANFNAVYVPGGQYAGWYDGMTNVNQFRVLFNTLFHQNMPMLKDSIVP